MRKHIALIIFIVFTIIITLIQPYSPVFARCSRIRGGGGGTSVCGTSDYPLYKCRDKNWCCDNPAQECQNPSIYQEDAGGGNNTGGETGNEEGSLGRIGGEEGLGPFANFAGGLTEAGSAFENVISFVIGIITIGAGLWFMIQVFIGGINWLTAGGDAKNLESARHRITNAFIGLIIVIAAWTIIAVASTVLGLKILNPGDIISNFSLTGESSTTDEAGTGGAGGAVQP